MIVTSTSSVEDKKITQYLGIVSGETVIGANRVQDFFAGLSDVVGGRAETFDNALRDAKEMALREMSDRAKQKGANAIVGVDLDYANINNMLLVVATGTAVWIE
jgi:uncharacterized protein YbjQ (UPF0145 family)